MAKNRPNQGSKKTETLTLRLDPKVKFLIDLLARHKRQSITGVAESAVQNYARNYTIEAKLLDEKGEIEELKTLDLYDYCEDIYSTDESHRFYMLCITAPHLLTYEELRLKETIYSSRILWNKFPNATCTYDEIDTEKLARHWDRLLAHVDEHKGSTTVVPYLAK